MTPQDPRIEAIFHEALTGVPAEREAFVMKACAGDEALHREVRRLLAAHEDAGAYFERPNSPEIEAELARLKSEEEGERIGRYKLLQEIGQGGFGTVWMAEQMEPLSRRVALKIIKMGMDTKEVIARFEAERQALAMMDHSNIAKVFDAGATPFGRPYFVMELVKGVPITEFCDEQQLNTRQRLQLFADVCAAINHAHQKGVIHRDIKPSNVMVTLHGDQAVVKVIDFGIAKAIQGKLTDKTLFTRFEQFIGTPVYMSPEQATMSGLDIDTRSDIYALGILLYELLTGKPPFDAKSLVSAGYEEMRRIICEVEPARPSLRLSTVSAEERTTLAKARHIEPEKLSRTVEPDLDWIVMRAIEKDRTHRYETANGLALDIQRFLANEPVSAGPPTAAYRFRKFARRNKAALRMAAAIAILLLVATAVSLWQAVRATSAGTYALQKAADESIARSHAEAARMESEATVNFLISVFANPEPRRYGLEYTMAESLTGALEKLKTELASYPERRYKLQESIAWVMYTNGMAGRIISYAEETRDYFVAARPAEHLDVLKAKHNLGIYYMALRRWEDATKLLEEIYVIEKRIFPPEHSEHLELMQTMTNLSACYFALDRKQQALAMREEAHAACQAVNYSEEHFATVRAKEGLAISYHEAGRFEEALKLRQEVLLNRKRNFKELHPEPYLAALQYTSETLDALDRSQEALAFKQESSRILRNPLIESKAALFKATTEKANAALAARRLDDAIELYRQLTQISSVFIASNSSGPEPEARVASALLLRASAERRAGLTGKAVESAREAEQIIETLLRQRVSFLPNNARVIVFSSHGHWNEAAAFSRPLYELFPRNPLSAFRRGPLLLKTGEIEAYEALCQEIIRPFAAATNEQLEPLIDSVIKDYSVHGLSYIAKVVCLRSPTAENLKWAVILADRAVALRSDPNRNWLLLTKAFTQYRGGEFPKVISNLESLIPQLPPSAKVSAQAVLAMTRYQMNERQSAEKAFHDGEALFTARWFSETRITLKDEGDPHDWLIADILLREAKALVTK